MSGLDLLRELVGVTCRCGNPKSQNKSFCAPCFNRLPAHLQRDLYKRFGKGYEQAYAAAVDVLEREVLDRPASGSSSPSPPSSPAHCTCGRGPIDNDPNCPLHHGGLATGDRPSRSAEPKVTGPATAL